LCFRRFLRHILVVGGWLRSAHRRLSAPSLHDGPHARLPFLPLKAAEHIPGASILPSRRPFLLSPSRGVRPSSAEPHATETRPFWASSGGEGSDWRQRLTAALEPTGLRFLIMRRCVWCSQPWHFRACSLQRRYVESKPFARAGKAIRARSLLRRHWRPNWPPLPHHVRSAPRPAVRTVSNPQPLFGAPCAVPLILE